MIKKNVKEDFEARDLYIIFFTIFKFRNLYYIISSRLIECYQLLTLYKIL